MEDKTKKSKEEDMSKKSCQELRKTVEGKTYLYNNRCRTCQHFRRSCFAC